VDFIESLLLLDLPEMGDQIAALGFATRFQQVTGPVTAKALEDTVFYRYNRLIGLNEVGGAPEVMGDDPEAVHAALAGRAVWPLNLNGTATHDTKRGEDARTRLYALTLAPERWTALAGDWAGRLAPLWEEGFDGEVTWTFLQTLLGVWPPELAPDDPDGMAALTARVTAFFEKAGREAKSRTSWTQIDDAYEARVRGFLARALDPAENGAFLASFAEAIRPFVAAGDLLSLGQTAIKLCAPGAPDVYQGSEGGDLSLVDPDNRRPPDFAVLARAAETPEPRFAKLGLIRAVLAQRAATPAIFDGAYRPLAAPPDRAFAFARASAAGTLICAVPIRTQAAALTGLSDAPAAALSLDLGAAAGRLSLVAGTASRDGARLHADPFDGPVVALLT
jgi:(1->4)-alpha-D-glucan 1-alpha-D-glucosylmutase